MDNLRLRGKAHFPIQKGLKKESVPGYVNGYLYSNLEMPRLQADNQRLFNSYSLLPIRERGRGRGPIKIKQ
jgi:hypothetical protein